MRIRDLAEVRDVLRGLVSLEDVCAEYGISLQSVGSSHFKAVCPFHDDTDPSLSISVEKQLYRCHGCKRGGDLFTFVMEMETLSFIGAVRWLADIAGYDLTPHLREPTQEEQEEQELCDLNEKFWKALTDPSESSWPSERHINPKTLTAYGVKYSPAPISVTGSKEYKRRLRLTSPGLWTGSIAIPLRDMSGRITGFRNRMLQGDVKIKNPLESHPIPLPPLYGLYEARSAVRDRGFAIVVEGEVDVWQMVQHGYPNTVGMMGTNFGEEQIRYLETHGVRSVVLLPDGDKAGRKFARRFASSNYRTSLSVKIALLPDGDPDDVLLRDPSGVEIALTNAQYAFEYLIDSTLSGYSLDDITEKIDALTDLRGYFSVAPEYQRSLAVGELAERLDMERDAIEDFFREQYDVSKKSPLTNVRAERIVLAGMVQDEEFVGEALMSLRSEFLYLGKHRKLFESIAYLYTTRDTVNLNTVATYLGNRGEEQLVLYLQNVIGHDEPESRAYMLQDIRDKAIRRSVQKQARDVMLRLGDTSNDANTEIRALSASLAHAVVGEARTLRSIDEVVRERMTVTMERVRNPSLIVGMDLGSDWTSINLALRGLQDRRFTVIAAPTTVGKTAIAGCWAQRVAVGLNQPTLYCTFETGDDILSERMISNLSGVESDKIATGYLTEQELEAVQDYAATLAASPLVITRAGRGLNELLSVVRHDCMVRGTKLVVVDYLQLMHVEGWRDRRDLELGFVSSSLLEVANELDTHVVALAQISREGTKSGSPRMEHTGDAYRIAQDCDHYLVVRFKTPEEVQLDGIQMGNRFGFLDKNRGGRRGIGFSVLADEPTSRFREVQHADSIGDRPSGIGQNNGGPEIGLSFQRSLPEHGEARTRSGRRRRKGRGGS